MNIKNTLLTFFSITLLAACGGGSGGGDSTPAPIPTPAPTPAPEPTPAPYSYYKISDEVSDGFVWDSFALASDIEWFEPGTINGVFSETWLRTYCLVGFSSSNPLDTTVTEYSNAFRIELSGTDNECYDINYNLNLNEFNTSIIELFVPGASEPSYALLNGNFADISVTYFGALNLAEQGIEYIDGNMGIIYSNSLPEELRVPLVYGDSTEVEDMPNGTISKTNLDTIAFYHEAEYLVDSTYSAQVAWSGASELTFNHTDGTFTGSIELNQAMDLEQFLLGNGPDYIYGSVGVLTLSVSGIISGNRFYGDVDYSGDNGTTFGGYIDGGFFGPNGSEVGASVIFVDNDGEFVDDLAIGQILFLGE